MKVFLKNDKGITMISLVVTIFLLAIVVGTVVYYSRSIIETAKFENIKSNMILIQTQAKILYEKHNIDNTIPLLGTLMESGYYELSTNDLLELGLDEIVKDLDTEKEAYYVYYPQNSNEEVNVKYWPGITYEKVVYNELSSIMASKL